MAMAVVGANRHYRWADILPRHWLTTAAAVGLNATVVDDLQQLAEYAPDVVEQVSSMLPAGFPSGVSDPIFAGLLEAAQRLTEIG